MTSLIARSDCDACERTVGDCWCCCRQVSSKRMIVVAAVVRCLLLRLMGSGYCLSLRLGPLVAIRLGRMTRPQLYILIFNYYIEVYLDTFDL